MAPSANIYSPPLTKHLAVHLQLGCCGCESVSSKTISWVFIKRKQPSNKLSLQPIYDYGLVTSRKCVSRTVYKVVYEENKARYSQNKCTTSFHISLYIGKSKYTTRQISFNILTESNLSQFETNFIPYKLKKTIVMLY